MQTFKKGNKIQLSEHFSTLDFDCKCRYPICKLTLIDEKLLFALERLWKQAGSFRITSGYRCALHNEDVGGVKNSFHTQGKAADVESTRSLGGRAMANYCDQIPDLANSGIGISFLWIHIDMRGSPARWIYPTNFRS